jgi:uncharacterized protein (DUF1015 family)
MNEYHDSVYDAGAQALRLLMAWDGFIQEEEASYYIYQLEMGGRTSTGLFTGVRAVDYRKNKIIRHENTRPDKEDDRTRHIVSQRAHAEPVMLLHPDNVEIDHFLQDAIREPALLEVQQDGITHRIWVVKEKQELGSLYQNIPAFYLADGHHRCAAAARAADQLEQEYPAAKVLPAVVFGSTQMNLMAYNRVVYKADAGIVGHWLKQASIIETGNDKPTHSGCVSLYTTGQWHTIVLDAASPESNAAEKLDVQRLQDQVLGPVFGIQDPRTDGNIGFVGGIRGTEELKRLVDEGKAAIAFSMHPTSAEELIQVSDAGLLMPPKSTWFEPKLRSGLLVHVFS